jgi:hypothetical protein
LKCRHVILCSKVPGLSKRRLHVCGPIDVVVKKPSKENAEPFVADI